MKKKIDIKIFFIVLLIILAGGVSYTSYYFYDKFQKLAKNPDFLAKKDVEVITKKVGVLMELPEEQASIATIVDKEKLKDQPFFAKSENGDKILIFSQTKKAILYRPKINKIIEVAPLVLGDNTANNQTPVQQPPKIKTVIYNGTDQSGLAAPAQKKLEEQISNLEVVSKANAKKTNYNKNLVIDLNGNRQKEVEQIGSVLGAEVSQMPDGENKPDADILVIIGKK